MHRTFVSQAIVLLRPLLSCLGDDFLFISVFLRICLYWKNKSGLSLTSEWWMNEHKGREVKDKQLVERSSFICSKLDWQIYDIIIINLQRTF